MASFFRNLTPSGRGLVIGVPSVAGMFYLFWTNLQRQQHKKNVSDSPAAIPTWQHRLNQAHEPVAHADNPATLRSEVMTPGGGSGTGIKTKTDPVMGGNSSGAASRSTADSIVSSMTWPAGQQENAGEGPWKGEKPKQPAQNPTGVEGKAYTKRQDYEDNFNENSPKSEKTM